MTVKSASYSYGITYGKDNPFIIGIGCIIAGVALGLPMVFAFFISKGIIQMSTREVIIALSLYVGGITIALALSMTLPKIIPAARSVKITGKIADFKDELDTSRSGQRIYTPIVEYEYEGQPYRVELSSWSTKKPVVGSPASLHINSKKPEKVISTKEVVFCIFALIIFTGAGILFGSLGFKADNWEHQPAVNNGDGKIGIIIWAGFVVFWLLLGIIICIVTSKKKANKTLKEKYVKTPSMIVDVNVNKNVIINGMHPVKITCSVSGTMYTVKTKTAPEKCEYRPGRMIDLYIDPNNSKRFYADI